MEKETYTHVKISKSELITIIAKHLGVGTSQVSSFSTYDVDAPDTYDGYEWGGINLSYKEITK